MVKDFLKDRTAYVRLRDATSSKRVTRGCPQGSVSGPTLWNIISDLFAVLSKVPKFECVTFADDILLMLQGHSNTDVLSTALTTLRIVEDWCKMHKLEISKDKTSLMPMFIRNSDTYKNRPEIKSWGLKVVTKMKYLGIMLDSKMDWFLHTHST